jgi:hypothetical protein
VFVLLCSSSVALESPLSAMRSFALAPRIHAQPILECGGLPRVPLILSWCRLGEEQQRTLASGYTSRLDITTKWHGNFDLISAGNGSVPLST